MELGLAISEADRVFAYLFARAWTNRKSKYNYCLYCFVSCCSIGCIVVLIDFSFFVCCCILDRIIVYFVVELLRCCLLGCVFVIVSFVSY